jgi:hypothetical protein
MYLCLHSFRSEISCWSEISRLGPAGGIT